MQNKYDRTNNRQNLIKISQLESNFKRRHLLDDIIYHVVNSKFTEDATSVLGSYSSRPYKTIGEKNGYSEDWVGKIIRQFAERDLLVVSNAEIRCQNRIKIQLTEKLANHMGLLDTPVTCVKAHEEVAPATIEDCPNESEEQNFDQQHWTETAENPASIPYMKGVKAKGNNIVRHTVTCPHVDKKQGQLYNLPDSVDKMFKNIGERLELRQKSAIWGAIVNLQTEHKKVIANPAEFLAWTAFSILNADHQIKHTKDFVHRLNAVMWLARYDRYERPIGFHSQWDIGQAMATEAEEKRKQLQRDKESYAREDSQSALNPVAQKQSSSEIKSRFNKTPDGDWSHTATVTANKDTPESIKLKDEMHKIQEALATVVSKIKGDEMKLSFNEKAEKKGKAILTDEQKAYTTKCLKENQIDAHKYRQALIDIYDAIVKTEAKTKAVINERYENRLPYVAIYEQAC